METSVIAEICRLMEHALSSQENSTVFEVDTRPLKSVEGILRHTFGGCPKRNICGFHNAKNKTCFYGPYTYCGKFRSIVQPDRKTKIVS